MDPNYNPNAATQTPTAPTPSTDTSGFDYNLAAKLNPGTYSATYQNTPAAPSTISSTSLAPTTPIDYQTPNYPTPYPVAGLGTPVGGQADPYANTGPQQEAQTLSTQLQQLHQTLAGEPAFQTDQYAQYGYGTKTDANGNLVAVDPAMTDLQAQNTRLTNEALQIPLQIANDQQGRGTFSNGYAPITQSALRANAIEALQVNSLIANKQGLLQHAKDLVDIATQQKFGPAEADLKAKTANLQLVLNSPDYTNAEKKQAAAQLQQQQQIQAQTELAKTNYTNTQNEVLKYAGIADAQTLNAMSKAQSPAEVAQIAAQAGIQQPQAGRYQDQTTTIKNLDGSTSIVRKIFDTVTGKFVDTPAGASASTLNAQSPASHASSSGVTGITGSPTVNATTPGYSSTIVPNSGGLTQAAIDQAAIVFATTGKFPTGIGIGGTGLAGQKKTAIQNRAAELNAGGNMTANAANLKSYSTSLTTQQKYLDTVQRSFDTANANLNVLTAYMAQAGINSGSSIPLVNSLQNAVKSGLLAPGTIAAFNSALIGLRQEYSQVLSRGGARSVSTDNEAAQLIPANLTPSQLQQVTDRINAEGTNAVNEAQGQVTKIQSQINSILSPTTPRATQTQQVIPTEQIPAGYYQASDGLLYKK